MTIELTGECASYVHTSESSYNSGDQCDSLHRIAPYIGRMRPALAKSLVSEYSSVGGWVWDPFCGSGTVPLECRLLARNVIAGDVNPYACMLTRAKLHAPRSNNQCISSIFELTILLREQMSLGTTIVQDWVTKFFHPQTLNEIRILFSILHNRRDYFLTGCLLGILHHQRPGFLSLSYMQSSSIP